MPVTALKQSQSHSASKSESFPQQLEAIRSEVWLTIQTKEALQLLKGRAVLDKPRIAGLFGFADRLRLITHAAAQDDPYADWWLIKVDQSIDKTDFLIRQHEQSLSDIFGEMQGLRIVPMESKDTLRVRLQFAVPAAYRGAASLSRFDRLARDLCTARHVGLLDNNRVSEHLRTVKRRIRSTFNLPNAFRRSGLTRASYLRDEAVSERMQAYMGPLPLDVLLGERRSPWAPPIASESVLPLSEAAADLKVPASA